MSDTQRTAWVQMVLMTRDQMAGAITATNTVNECLSLVHGWSLGLCAAYQLLPGSEEQYAARLELGSLLDVYDAQVLQKAMMEFGEVFDHNGWRNLGVTPVMDVLSFRDLPDHIMENLMYALVGGVAGDVYEALHVDADVSVEFLRDLADIDEDDVGMPLPDWGLRWESPSSDKQEGSMPGESW